MDMKMLLQTVKTALLAGLVWLSSVGTLHSQLNPISAEEMSSIAAEAGITVGLSGGSSQDIIYTNETNTNDIGKLIFWDSNANLNFSDLKVDVVPALGVNAALQLTLPTEVTFTDFSTGRLILSVDDVPDPVSAGAPPAQFTDAPVRQTYQAVLTASNYRFDGDGDGNFGEGNDTFNQNLLTNNVQLQIQDVGRLTNGTLSGSGRLRIGDWTTQPGSMTQAVLNSAIGQHQAGAAYQYSGAYQSLITEDAIHCGVFCSNNNDGVLPFANNIISTSSCDASGNNCTTQSGAFSAASSGSGVVKYDVILNSRLFQSPAFASTRGGVGCFEDNGTGGNDYNCNERALSEGLGFYTSNSGYQALSAANFTALSSAQQLAYDPRVVFSTGKETEVRLQAVLVDCSGGCDDYDDSTLGALFGTNGAPDPVNQQEHINPAVVLLDASGNVLTSDNSSGGSVSDFDTSLSFNDGENDGDIYNTNVQTNDDEEYFEMGLLEVTLGDPLYGSAKDRILGGAVIGAPPEATAPITALQGSSLSSSGSMQLGGNIKVFAQ